MERGVYDVVFMFGSVRFVHCCRGEYLQSLAGQAATPKKTPRPAAADQIILNNIRIFRRYFILGHGWPAFATSNADKKDTPMNKKDDSVLYGAKRAAVTAPYVLHLIDEDFDIHFVPHSQKANAAIKRNAKARGMSALEYLIDETALMLMLGVDPEKEEQTAVTARDA